MFNLYKVIKVNFSLEQYIWLQNSIPLWFVMFHHDQMQDAVEDLLAEIRILSHISHPRLVPLVGACLEESQVAMVTELQTGGNLHHALHVRKVDFTRVQHYQIAIEFLEGVRYLHALAAPSAALGLEVHEFGARCGISACQDLCLGIIELREERQAECCILVNMIAAHGSTSRLKRPQALS